MSTLRTSLINALNTYKTGISPSRAEEFSREARIFISLAMEPMAANFTVNRLVEVFDFGFRNRLSWAANAGHISLLAADDGNAGFYVHYRGHLVLAGNYQIISRCTAELIYETDDFQYLGEDRRPHLVRRPTKDPGDVVGGYTLSYLPDGSLLCLYFNYEDLQKAEQMGIDAGNGFFWTGPHRREMQRKSLIVCTAKRWTELRLTQSGVKAA